MRYSVLLILVMLFFNSVAQNTGLYNPLDGNKTGWVGGGGYFISTPRTTDIRVDESGKTNVWKTFSYSFSALNLAQFPYLQLKISASSTVKVRVDLQDANGNVTNKTPLVISVQGDGSYNTYTYDFTGKFQTNTNATVLANNITQILVYLNPGSNFDGGYVYLDDLRIGDQTSITPPEKQITLNQIGFHPNLTKIGIVANSSKSKFYIVSSDKKDTVFTGNLSSAADYTYSGDKVKKADFTSFRVSGKYYLTADSIFSYPFTIDKDVYSGISKGLIKSYYFNRASAPVTSTYGGKWARTKGHADNQVYVHSSGAYPDRPVNTIFSSSRGWYDAGDYNKYVVNSGISTYSILAMYEHFPEYFDTLNTNIPESNNAVPDILDEALWNVRWLFTTQAPDGGVYHKITSLDFCGDVMPASDPLQRYAVGRGTAATLDFAAVMAQSYRIFKNFPNELPGLADSCIHAALLAYDWALDNPNNKITANPAGVTTGAYGDNTVNDEFAWARMELYAATRNDVFYNRSEAKYGTFNIPGWPNVNTLGLITLVNYRKQLNVEGYKDTLDFNNKLIALANTYYNGYNSSPYGVAIGTSQYDFGWGSNATAGNQGIVLLQAFRLTGDSSYLKAALSNLDYVFGRNAARYSYVTGYGSKTPMDPHHRISFADGIAEPTPGMVVGGANPGQQDGCTGYTSGLPAKSYVDSYCSYASNEPAINYTAAVAYMVGGIQGVMLNASYVPEYTEPPVNPIGPLGVTDKSITIPVGLYPNPSKGEFSLEFMNKGTARIQVTDVTGKVVMEETVSENNLVVKTMNINHLPEGIYMLVITNDEGGATKKIIKQ